MFGVGGVEPATPSPDRRVEAVGEAAKVRGPKSAALGSRFIDLAKVEGVRHHRSAGHSGRLASGWVLCVLAVEMPRWAAGDSAESSRVDPAHRCGESSVGRASHPGRVGHAGAPVCSGNDRQVPWRATKAFADVADVHPQPHGDDGGDGFLHRADDHRPGAECLRASALRAAAFCPFQCDRGTFIGVGRQATKGRLPVRLGTSFLIHDNDGIFGEAV